MGWNNEPLLLRYGSPLASGATRTFAERLEAEDLHFVHRRLIEKAGRTNLEAYIARIYFLQYLLLVYHFREGLAPGKLDDEYWHAFILHTREYEIFCNKYFGHFLHHLPAPSFSEKTERRPETSDRLRDKHFHRLIDIKWRDEALS